MLRQMTSAAGVNHWCVCGI